MQLNLERLEGGDPDGPQPAVASSLDRAAPAFPHAGRVVYHVFLWLMIAAIVPLLWGWRATVVTSASMSPSVDTGDIVVTAPHSGAGLRPGDIAVFSDGSGGQVAHRIVGVNSDGSYVTRGDANPSDDSTPLVPTQVVGVGRMLIPFVGLPIVWFAKGNWIPFVWVVTIGAAGFFWWRLVRRRAEEEW